MAVTRCDVACAIELGRCQWASVPVTTDDEMVGIISIGDVVKSRLDQLEYEKARLAEENEQITEYIQTGR